MGARGHRRRTGLQDHPRHEQRLRAGAAHLGGNIFPYISAISPLYLPYISAISRLYLPITCTPSTPSTPSYISAISPLYLAYISPVQRLHAEHALDAVGDGDHLLGRLGRGGGGG